MNNQESLTIKRCPICGSVASIKISSLEEPLGRGYPGHFHVTIRCSLCDLPTPCSANDVYGDASDMVNRAIVKWNGEVDRIQILIDKKNG